MVENFALKMQLSSTE